MSPSLFATASRALSTSMRRRIISQPKRGGDKLTNSALSVFIKKNYAAAAGNSKKPLKVFASLRKKFASLSSTKLRKYKAVAAQNRRAIRKRACAFKGARMSSYVLFVKTAYKNAPKNIKSKGFVEVSKYVRNQWKALGKAGQAKYVKRAASIRKASSAQRDRMIAAYKKA